MSTLPLSLLFGTIGTLFVSVIYFLWARKVPTQSSAAK
jgi:hypothetical protein